MVMFKIITLDKQGGRRRRGSVPGRGLGTFCASHGDWLGSEGSQKIITKGGVLAR